jgi:orotate phosphoribosyltransferase
MAAYFTYGFAVSEENFKNANIDLFLSNYQNLLNLLLPKAILVRRKQTLREWNEILLLGIERNQINTI